MWVNGARKIDLKTATAVGPLISSVLKNNVPTYSFQRSHTTCMGSVETQIHSNNNRSSSSLSRAKYITIDLCLAWSCLAGTTHTHTHTATLHTCEQNMHDSDDDGCADVVAVVVIVVIVVVCHRRAAARVVLTPTQHLAIKIHCHATSATTYNTPSSRTGTCMLNQPRSDRWCRTQCHVYLRTSKSYIIVTAPFQLFMLI